MVSQQTRDCAQVKVPPPLIFFALVGIASALEYWLGIDYPRGPIELRGLVALLLFLFSGYLALHAVVVLKKGGTYVDTNRPTTQIMRDGPFIISRNPMYLSLVLLSFALSIFFLSIWFSLATAALWIVLDRFAVAPEESYLERKFGESFVVYKSRVRRWF